MSLQIVGFSHLVQFLRHVYSSSIAAAHLKAQELKAPYIPQLKHVGFTGQLYNFKQAKKDRLEDAGIKTYGQQPETGFHADSIELSKRTSLLQRMRVILVAAAKLVTN